jgi:hyperosmotically inducible protein
MSMSQWLISAALVCIVGAGSACTQDAADQTTNTTGTVLDEARKGTDTALDAIRESAATVIDETKNAGEETVDVTKNLLQKTGETTKEIAGKTGDKTKEIAGKIADKSEDVASATGEAITDGWITTKVSAKFVDETLLKGSSINVDTNNHVVTLKGTVGSDAAKARAAAIARGTKGVTRLVNQLVVRET